MSVQTVEHPRGLGWFHFQSVVLFCFFSLHNFLFLGSTFELMKMHVNKDSSGRGTGVKELLLEVVMVGLVCCPLPAFNGACREVK